MKILAIDQGTTSTRAFLVDQDGNARSLIARPHRQIYPEAGWVEHDPQELITNLRACLEAAAGIPDLAAVGIDNQGESCLAWDAENLQPIGPVVVWQDNRTAGAIERLKSDGAESLTRSRAGLPLDPYFSASKMSWLIQNLPDARQLAGLGRLRLGTTDAYFRHVLCGRCETDVTTASRTSLMNLTSCEWDEELCRLFGVPIEALPQITSSTGDLGDVQVGSARLPLTASIVDQQAAVYGHGCRKAGDAKITFGTGAFALALTGSELIMDAKGALPTVAWRKSGEHPTYALDGGVFSAAAAVNWAQSIGLFDKLAEIQDFDRPPAISRGLVFVPALAGLACPHWDPKARGAWMGMSLDTDRRDLVQAVLEGVAFRMAEVFDTLHAALPLASPVSVDGGMSNNRWFCGFLADALGRDLLISDEAELTALGTAALAADGAGLTLDISRSGRPVKPKPQPVDWIQGFTSARRMVGKFGARD